MIKALERFITDVMNEKKDDHKGKQTPKKKAKGDVSITIVSKAPKKGSKNPYYESGDLYE